MAKSTGIKRYVGILFIIIITLLLIIFGFWLGTGKFSETKINQTVVQNIEEKTIVEADDTNIWDTLIIIGGLSIFALVIIISLKMYFNFKSSKNVLTRKNKELCAKKAYEELKKEGFDVGFEKPKWSYKYYGVDEEGNPAWVFIFVTSLTDPTKDLNTIDCFNMISCFIDAKTFEVWNEAQGKDPNQIKLELNEQRFGKVAVPNFPGKTEHKPSIADLFNTDKTNINLNPTDFVEDDSEDEE
jgi:hypothetical protein